MNSSMRVIWVGWFVIGCEAHASSERPAECMGPEQVAGYVHTVIEADRATYAEQVVHRLQDVEQRIKASASFVEDKALPLPSQMLRMGSKAATARAAGGLHYALISPWAINKANLPKTEFEKTGFQQLERSPDKPYQAYQQVGGKRYFTALFADKAVSEACVSCHNSHPDSPRTDFKQGDVMGGIAISMLIK